MREKRNAPEIGMTEQWKVNENKNQKSSWKKSDGRLELDQASLDRKSLTQLTCIYIMP